MKDNALSQEPHSYFVIRMRGFPDQHQQHVSSAYLAENAPESTKDLLRAILQQHCSSTVAHGRESVQEALNLLPKVARHGFPLIRSNGIARKDCLIPEICKVFSNHRSTPSVKSKHGFARQARPFLPRRDIPQAGMEFLFLDKATDNKLSSVYAV